MPTTRLEAFSDGVFAIAITILVLDLRVPPPALAHGGRLGHLLLGLWPNYASYVVSFLVIGIIWVNHHGLFHHVGRVTGRCCSSTCCCCCSWWRSPSRPRC
jgi:uncharacterized membrane protein